MLKLMRRQLRSLIPQRFNQIIANDVLREFDKRIPLKNVILSEPRHPLGAKKRKIYISKYRVTRVVGNFVR